MEPSKPLYDNLVFCLDMDGVCCDWPKAAAKLAEVDFSTLEFTGTELHLSSLFPISETEVWKRVEATEGKFWENLEEYPWFKDFYAELTKLGKVIFATSPSRDLNSPSGKAKWLAKRIPDSYRKFQIGKTKELLAGDPRFHRRVLIDDTMEMINAFRAERGTAILFPQPWNTPKDELPEDPALHVLRQIYAMLSE